MCYVFGVEVGNHNRVNIYYMLRGKKSIFRSNNAKSDHKYRFWIRNVASSSFWYPYWPKSTMKPVIIYSTYIFNPIAICGCVHGQMHSKRTIENLFANRGINLLFWFTECIWDGNISLVTGKHFLLKVDKLICGTLKLLHVIWFYLLAFFGHCIEIMQNWTSTTLQGLILGHAPQIVVPHRCTILAVSILSFTFASLSLRVN